MEFVIIKPTLDDIDEMQALVKPEVDGGIILERTESEMANTIRSYTIAKIDGRIIGFCALHIHSKVLGEIRSLIVASEYRTHGVGKALVKEAIDEGRALGLKEILSLTYRRDFFEKLGFVEILKEKIPDSKIWLDCIKCKHFPVCDEISLILNL